MTLRRAGQALWLAGVLLLVGLSLGLYYNYTYFGTAAWPLPHPVALAGPLCYYLALPIGFDSGQQSVLWLASFPLAGGCMVYGAWWAMNVAGEARPSTPRAAIAGLLPLCLPAPWLAWLHAGAADARWSTFVDACLHRSFTIIPRGLPWLYLSLALAGTAVELALLLRGRPDKSHLLRRWLAGTVAGALAAAVLATLLGMIIGGLTQGSGTA